MTPGDLWASIGMRPVTAARVRQMIAEAVEATAASAKPRQSDESVRGQSAIKPGVMTRPQAAEFLQVSTRKLQRMEIAGKLQRCPDYGTLVRYSVSDVLRLASASSRKGA